MKPGSLLIYAMVTGIILTSCNRDEEAGSSKDGGSEDGSAENGKTDGSVDGGEEPGCSLGEAETVWVKRLDSASSENYAALKTMQENSIIFVESGYINKYNTNGKLEWSKKHVDEGNGGFFDVGTLSNGELITYGGFSGTITIGKGEKNETTLDENGGTFLAKRDTDGDLIWAKIALSKSSDCELRNFQRLAVFTDGSSVIGGDFRGEVVFGKEEENETMLVSEDDSSASFIARYDGEGDLSWAKKIANLSAYDLEKTPDDSYLVFGFMYEEEAVFGAGEPNETTLSLAPGMYWMYFVARYNAEGSFAWVKEIASSYEDWTYFWAAPAAFREDRSFVVTGGFHGEVAVGKGEGEEARLECYNTVGEEGELCVHIMSFAHDGELQWTRKAEGHNRPSGGRGEEGCRRPAGGRAIDVFSDGSALVSGFFGGRYFDQAPDDDPHPTQYITFGSGEDAVTLKSEGNADAFVAMYDREGNFLWARRDGGKGVDGAGDIALIDGNSLVVAGTFEDTVVFGSCEENETTLTSEGDSDIFLMKLALD